MGEIIINAIMVIISTVYLIGSFNFAFGSVYLPKLGFMPRIIGVLAVLISGFILIESIRKYRLGNQDTSFKVLTGSYKKLVVIIGAIILFVTLFRPLGYAVSSFIFLMLMMTLTKVGKNWKKILLSVLLSVVPYLMFKILLQVNLPQGIFPI